MNKNTMIKIIIVLLITAAIIGLWFIKQQKKHEFNDNVPDNIESSENTPSFVDPLAGADFSLVSTVAIDIEALSKYKLPIIIDYGSEGCVPCQSMKPALKAINMKMYRKAFIKYVDVWEYPEAAYDLPFNLIPTQFFYNSDGTPFVPSEELNQKIQFDFYGDNETGKHVYTTHTGPLTEEEFDLILKEMGVRYD